MTNVHMVGGHKHGHTITTSDEVPKDLWRFDTPEGEVVYLTMKVREEELYWYVAYLYGLSQEDALDLFLETHYVGLVRRKSR
ncbi:MAG: hypothetical protein ACYSW8_11050 [Planctomycetota bacterium]